MPKLWRRRKRERQKSNTLVSKTILHGHHALTSSSLHSYDVKWPSLKYSLNVYGKGVNLLYPSGSLFGSSVSPHFEDWTSWNNREKFQNDAYTAFERRTFSLPPSFIDSKSLLYGWLHQRARRSQTCVLIDYPSRQMDLFYSLGSSIFWLSILTSRLVNNANIHGWIVKIFSHDVKSVFRCVPVHPLWEPKRCSVQQTLVASDKDPVLVARLVKQLSPTLSL